MQKKEFKSLDEQVEILRKKGLIVNDIEKTRQALLRENYFFINGYRHLFLKSKTNKKFIEGVTFEELYALFKFDRAFRNILFKNLLIVENNLKSIISHELSKKYGVNEKDYLKFATFTKDNKKVRQVNDVINKIKRQIRVNGRKHSATLHFLSNYGYIPFWILVKLLSFGMINELYTILKPEDQQNIANIYNLDADTLSNYIALLSNYRNLCAHEDIVFDHKTQKEIDDTKYHRKLNIPLTNDEYIYGKNDIFSLIIVLKHVMMEQDFRLLIQEVSYELDVLDGKIESIEQEKILDLMGFPEGWKSIKDVKNDR